MKYKFVRFNLLVAIAVMAVGCGSTPAGGSGGSSEPAGLDSKSRIPSSAEAKHLLLQLPYHYRWRKVELPAGASGALAGTAIGKHRTIVHFGISLGSEPDAVSVPQAGLLTPYYYYGGGFVFNDDLVLPHGVGKQFHTATQWDEATTMVVEMQEKLCRAATGKACPA